MKKIQFIKIINIVLSLFLGGMLLQGGLKKFSGPMPTPTTQREAIKKGEFDQIDPATLKIKNYIFGMKQTGYFWQFLGISEVLVALLILSQVFRFPGALMAVPITIQIFLFHLYLEPHETGELLETGGLLAANVWLIGFEYPRWKHLIFTTSLV
ncbi:MAG: DoxX family membrane protein [Microscillaceae bacterium]